MPRRGRRSGVRFIENDRDRSLTFFKRRSGLYKAAADLSTLTGARVVIVLESESGKFSSFGTPAAGPIVNAFLSMKAPIGPFANKEDLDTITELQNELFQLEKDMVVEDKRNKDSISLVKDLQESSRLAKFAYGKVEDLDADDIREMYHGLSRVRQEIQHLLLTMHHGEQHEVGGLKDPSLMRPAWWRSLPSQMSAPRAFPWIPIRRSVQQMHPSQQLMPRSLASSMEPLQGVKMPAPQEAILYNDHIRGMGIDGNNSNLYFQSPVLSSPPPSQPSSPKIPQFNESSRHPPVSLQQFLLPRSLDGRLPFKAQSYNSTEFSQNFTSSGSSTPTDKPYYVGYNSTELSQNFTSSGSSTPTDKSYYVGYNSIELSQKFASSGCSTPTDKSDYTNYSFRDLSQKFASSGSSTPTDKPYYTSYNFIDLSQKLASSGLATPVDKPYYASYNLTELSKKFASSGSSTPTNKPYCTSYNSTELSQNFASSGSSTPTDKPYYACLRGLNIDMEKNSENEGQIDGDHHMLDLPGPLQGGDGWIDELLFESSIGGNAGGGAENNLGSINFP